MTFLALLFLLTAHYFAGSGLLHLFRIRLGTAKHGAISVISGIVLHSLIPMLLEMAHIPLTLMSVATGVVVMTVLLNVGRVRDIRTISWKGLLPGFPRIRIYEVPFMLVFCFILFASLWRSYYYPSNARDMLSGPEVLAEYAVKERTIINSVFTVNLESTNNHQKPPFILGLQIIYKFFGFPFGQVWISLIAISFCILLYQLLKEKLHPVLAGIFLLLFLAIPEVYAYTYMMLFDYSNMVLFFIGVYFYQLYFRSGEKKFFYFATLSFGFATFIRLETLALVAMMVPLYWMYAYQKKIPFKAVAVQTILAGVIPFLFYFVWVNVFMKYYLPGGFQLDSQVNPNLANLDPLFKRFREMNSELLFGRLEKPLWAHYIRVFLVVFVLDLVISRKLSKESLNWLYALAVVYFGLPLLGYLLPLMDLTNTTKRGLFKLMPIMLMLMAGTGILRRVSGWMSNWENEQVAAAAPPRQAPQQPSRTKRPKPVKR